MYRIFFLGTAGGGEAVLKQQRGSGGILLNLGSYQAHIDPGPGALARLVEFRINPRDTNIILTSHNHLEHCNDVNALIDSMTYAGLDNRGILISDESVVNGTEQEGPILSKTRKNYLEKVSVMKSQEEIKLGTLEIQSTLTKHRCNSTIGFKFVTARFTLGYTSDTAYFPELIQEFKGCDILIINNLRPFNSKKDFDSMSSDDSLNLIEGVKPKLAILTHFGSHILRENPIYQARELQKLTNIQTIAAKDGLMIDPIGYSSSIRQRSMSLY